MMGVYGLNALQIILASGFPGVTELGHIPASVVRLANLGEHVSLVRADESVTFHLAAKITDSVRSDTAIFSWIVEVVPTVVETPDYYLIGSEARTFQLLNRVSPPIKYPSLTFLQLPIKFVPSDSATSRPPELWLRTVVLHNDKSIAPYLSQGTAIGA